MNKKEFAIFADALRTYYPKEQILPNQAAMRLWYDALNDIPFEVASATLQKWAVLNRWSPAISDIREGALNITGGNITDWGEAWQAVLKSIGRYGMHRETEALNSLEPLTQDCVRRLGYKNLCLSENISADRANFRNLYETLSKREAETRKLPASLKSTIDFLLQPKENQKMLSDDKGG